MTVVIFLCFCLIFIALAVGSTRRPGIAVAIVLLLFPIKQVLEANSPLFARTSVLSNLIISAVAGIAWVGVRMRKQAFHGYAGNIRPLAAVFVTYLIVATAWSLDVSYPESTGPQALIYVLLMIFFMPELMNQEKDFQDTWTTYIFFSGVITLTLLTTATWEGRWIIFTYTDLTWNPGWGAFRNSTGNPLALATMAMDTILLILLLPSAALDKIVSWFRWLILFAATYLLLKTQARGPLVVTGFAVIVFYPIAKPLRSQRAIVSTVAIVALLIPIVYLVGSSISEDSRWGAERLAGDADVRLHIVEYSIKAWLATPLRFLFGYGYDASFIPDLDIGWPEVAPVALLVDGGLFAFLLWLCLLSKAVRAWLSSNKLAGNDVLRRSTVGVLGALSLSQFALGLKGERYADILGWALLIARHQAILKGAVESHPHPSDQSNSHNQNLIPQLVSG